MTRELIICTLLKSRIIFMCKTFHYQAAICIYIKFGIQFLKSDKLNYQSWHHKKLINMMSNHQYDFFWQDFKVCAGDINSFGATFRENFINQFYYLLITMML